MWTMAMRLEFGTLAKACGQLEESLGYLNSELAQGDDGLRRQFRAAAVQAFEYTYELSIRMIRRQLAQIAATPAELPKMDFMDLVRTAADAGLVRDVPAFGLYREMRNKTSHTYEEDRAEEVLTVLPGFVQDVRFLLAELGRRNSGGD
jgi:nucleotidyltransferase substrate binding protein (TIGR01987 family)